MLPPFYIGSSSVSRVKTGYNGTVTSRQYRRLWETEQRAHPELFATRVISTHATRAGALAREEQLQRQLGVVKNPLYTNLAYANRGFVITSPHSAETRAKISASKVGVKTGPRSEQTRKRQSAAAIGRTKSPEHRAAMSRGKIGAKQSSATIEKRRQSQLGQKRSPEMRGRMAAIKKNPTPEQRRRFSEAQRKRHENTVVRLKAPDGTMRIGTSLPDLCSEHGLQTTSMWRTLAAGKPLQRGPNTGWQLLSVEKHESNKPE
jgi:hypothetical protein